VTRKVQRALTTLVYPCTKAIEMARTIPLGGKLLAPDQIARTAVFLASEDANAITGQVLHVNGGSYMP
jgi:NAD(P)-dependent dehydrogenase (short-subunit alcohol dehydrogenase family)